MTRKLSRRPRYCYIQRQSDGSLFHGISACGDGSSKKGGKVELAHWRNNTNFDMARQFASVDNALAYAKAHHIVVNERGEPDTPIWIIDRYNLILARYDGTEDVQ